MKINSSCRCNGVICFWQIRFKLMMWLAELWSLQLVHLFARFAAREIHMIWSVLRAQEENEKSLWIKIMGTLTRIKSWIRLASPRLANTNRRVTGPGIPSVYPSAFLATVASPTGAFSLSSVCSVPADPPTNWMEKKWNYTKNETIF